MRELIVTNAFAGLILNTAIIHLTNSTQVVGALLKDRCGALDLVEELFE